MNTTTNDGGPAFPQPCTEGGHAANSAYGIAGGGLSVRDWFAGQALLLAGAYAIDMTLAGRKPPMNEADMARRAYATADAMLAARNATTNPTN